MAEKTALIEQADKERVEKTFAVSFDTLPTALGQAMIDLASLAREMSPDDIVLDLDLPAGTLKFRAYRRRISEQL